MSSREQGQSRRCTAAMYDHISSELASDLSNPSQWIRMCRVCLSCRHKLTLRWSEHVSTQGFICAQQEPSQVRQSKLCTTGTQVGHMQLGSKHSSGVLAHRGQPVLYPCSHAFLQVPSRLLASHPISCAASLHHDEFLQHSDLPLHPSPLPVGWALARKDSGTLCPQKLWGPCYLGLLTASCLLVCQGHKVRGQHEGPVGATRPPASPFTAHRAPVPTGFASACPHSRIDNIVPIGAPVQG